MIENHSGNSKIYMQMVDPDTIRSIFARVDVFFHKRPCAQFVVADLAKTSLIRSVHSMDCGVSKRLERHMSNEDSQYYFACMPLKGSLGIKHHGRYCELSAGKLGFVTTDEEYTIEMSKYLDAIWLRVPVALLRSYVVSMDEMLAHPFDISQGIGGAVLGLMCGSLKGSGVLGAKAANLVEQSMLGLLGEIINGALYSDEGATTLHRQKILARAREFIEAHLCDEDLTPQRIAETIGISQRYLSELFAAEGSSTMRWVQKRRLERCRMELELRGIGHQLIREIAYSFGFSNISSFNRAFKAHYGHSPKSLLALQ